jgi:flagellar L-ring protein precursor FlgH
LQIKGSSTIANPPTVDLNYSNEFSGDGKYDRRDTFTARIQARIIDIKPNGNLVLEARKMVQSDKESMEIVMTGTARPDDVTTANTLLSTQLYDLNLVKKHTGELRQATKKGPLTKLFEILFPF